MPDEFKNLKQAALWLREEGWKVGVSSVYEHAKKGMIKPDIEHKRYSQKAVLKYAQTHLVPVGEALKGEEEKLARQDKKVSIELKTEQLRRERLKRLREEGSLIKRDLVHAELASRGPVLETILKAGIQSRAGELIELVGGSQKLIGIFVREFFLVVDEALDQFSNNKEWQVLFQDEELDI